jgi:hypothetical protein
MGSLGTLVDHLGYVLGRLGGALGASWGVLGASWTVLGASWGVLGRPGGTPGRTKPPKTKNLKKTNNFGPQVGPQIHRKIDEIRCKKTPYFQTRFFNDLSCFLIDLWVPKSMLCLQSLGLETKTSIF